MTAPVIAPEVADWIERGRHDVKLFALMGLGIDLHAKQVEVAVVMLDSEFQYYLLTWANRAGKTTGVGVIHMHRLFYKIGVAPARNAVEHENWLKVEYRTLHAAPLNELAGRAFDAWNEIVQGVSPAQWDKVVGVYRPSPLAPFFALTKERDAAGSDHMFMRCITGGVTDFRSTEGKARRLESGTWRFISWDEWPQTENPDDIRTVLFVRLTARAADFDAPILLTGTITEETEHIAQEFIDYCEDPENGDWWGNTAERSMNPNASVLAMERAERNLDPEDYARTILGIPGGAKSRLFPPYMVDLIFRNELERFTPPLPGDGVLWDAPDENLAPVRRRRDGKMERELERLPRGRFKPRGTSPYTYLHIWDLALAAAANVGHVWRLPADWRFGYVQVDGKTVFRPIEGCKEVVIPGSRTLTTAEIIHTIEETYLPYGGLIVVDTTDAHGKNVYRELRRAGYPVEAFTFNERDERRVIRKDAAVLNTRALLTEGMELERDTAGEPMHDPDGVPKFDRTKPYGVLRLPRQWTKPKDQLSILRIDDSKQTKDHAMVVLMGCDVAYRERRGRTRVHTRQRFAVFAGRAAVDGRSQRRAQPRDTP
jgi:hypothetical protein